MIARYSGVPAAVDVFTLDNAATMLKSLRIVAGTLGTFSTHP